MTPKQRVLKQRRKTPITDEHTFDHPDGFKIVRADRMQSLELALGRRDALLRLAAEKIMCYQAEYGLKYVGGAVDLPARIESELKG